ncbi:hypothetical protein MPTA5024_35335 [Microbispora sp. ATCC PTA-5024]|nr:hypothetical protein MPTA5024_35335 [Microbispora sp. ATCC PTA-5024]
MSPAAVRVLSIVLHVVAIAGGVYLGVLVFHAAT